MNNPGGALTPLTPIEERPITVAEAKKFASTRELSIHPDYAAPKGWIHCRVDPRQLYNMYGAIGPVEAFKGELLCNIPRSALDAAAAVNEEFGQKVYTLRADLAAVVFQGPSGRGYAGDGNKRTLNACLRNVDWIEAILVPVDVDWAE